MPASCFLWDPRQGICNSITHLYPLKYMEGNMWLYLVTFSKGKTAYQHKGVLFHFYQPRNPDHLIPFAKRNLCSQNKVSTDCRKWNFAGKWRYRQPPLETQNSFMHISHMHINNDQPPIRTISTFTSTRQRLEGKTFTFLTAALTVLQYTNRFI